MLLQGVDRATLYGGLCGPAGDAPGAAYPGPVSRPLRDVPARPDLLLPALAAALDGTGPAVGTGAAGGTTVCRRGRASWCGRRARPVSPAACCCRRPRCAPRPPRRPTGSPARGTGCSPSPLHHVAGLQVLVRSVLAGTTPTVAARRPVPRGGVRRGDRRDAAAPGRGTPRSCPPSWSASSTTPPATDALRSFDAVLRRRRRDRRRTCWTRARAAGVAVVTTYGMSETCGGCVYDGAPARRRRRPDRRRRPHPAGRPGARRRLPGRRDLDAEPFVQVGRGPLAAHVRPRDVGRRQAHGARPRRRRPGHRRHQGAARGGRGGRSRAPASARWSSSGVPDEEWGQVVVAVVVPAPGGPHRRSRRSAPP